MMTREARKNLADKAYDMRENGKKIWRNLPEDKTQEQVSQANQTIYELQTKARELEQKARMHYNGYGYLDYDTGLCNMG